MHRTIVPSDTAIAPLSLRDVRLLAVDDHSDCRDFLCTLFQLLEADARVVSSASQALDLFLQFQPQILVIDLAMPSVDGFGFLESIRSLEERQNRPKTPAIAVTALDARRAHEQAEQVGFDALLLKPLNIDAFIMTVNYLIATH